MAIPTDYPDLAQWLSPSSIVNTGGRVETWSDLTGLTTEGVTRDMTQGYPPWIPHYGASGYASQPYVYCDQFWAEPGYPGEADGVGLGSELFNQFRDEGPAGYSKIAVNPNFASDTEAHWFARARLDRCDLMSSGQPVSEFGALIYGNVFTLGFLFGQTGTSANPGPYVATLFQVHRNVATDGFEFALVSQPITLGEWVWLEGKHSGGQIALTVNCEAPVTTSDAGDSVSSDDGFGYSPQIVEATGSGQALLQWSVSEIVAYKRALSTSERDGVMQYLGAPCAGAAGFRFVSVIG